MGRRPGLSRGKKHKKNTILAKARVDKGYTMEGLAKASGMSINTIDRIENLHLYPTPEFQRKIVSVLDVTEEILFPPHLYPADKVLAANLQSHDIYERRKRKYFDLAELAEQPVPSTKLPTFLDEEIKKEIAAQINEVVETLPPRERGIIEARYGLGEKEELTLEELGGVYSKSREGIRHIVGKTLERLRNHEMAEQLEECLID